MSHDPTDEARPSNIRRLLRREGIVLAKVLAPFFAILIIVAYFHAFVFNAILANVAINGLIITAALYGVVLIVVRLVSAQMDYYVIERFGYEAMQGVYMPTLLEQHWLKRRDVRHYLGHIAKTGGTLASALQQNAIENELRTLSSDYEHKMELPQFIVGFMIAMGLLGTFIGLLTTLTGISSMLDGFGASGGDMSEQFMKMVGELRKPLAGMGIAFSASMFGLVTSLMLAIMMIALRRYIGRVVSCARNVMHNLTELGRGSGAGGGGGAQMSPDDIAALMGAGKSRKTAGSIEGESSLQDLVYQVNDTSLLVANRIDGLTQKIDGLLRVFETSVKLTQKQNDLLAAMPRISDTNDKILKELKEMTSGQIEDRKNTQMIVDANGQAARGIEDSMKAQRETQATLSLSLRGLDERLMGIGEGIASLGQYVADFKEDFTTLGSYSGSVETIASGIGHQTLLLETLVKEDRNLQKRLVSIQQDVREHLDMDNPEDQPAHGNDDFIP